jgi:4-diphosphocytidyl-2-C-methyl-D-erythritol kinase
VRVVELARAKINLALHVIQRRPDGYHELDSIVAFASVGDLVTVEPADELSFAVSGPFAKGLTGTGDNSVLAAWRAVAKITNLKPVKFRLEKNLPIASGIGGGSADAAAALRGLIKCFNLEITADALGQAALQLGADVPVCLASTTARMRGIGEIIEPFQTPLPKAIILANPLQPCSTPDVFQALGLSRGQKFGGSIADIDGISSWRNDLAAPAIEILPGIAEVLDVIGAQPGIICARMSGSGATCFGLLDSLDEAKRAAVNIRQSHPDWWVAAASLG